MGSCERPSRSRSGLAMIALKPFGKLSNADLDWRIRFVADVGNELIDIGETVRHVAELQRLHDSLALAAETFFEQVDIAEQLDRAIAADVVDSVGRAAGGGIGIRAVPGRVGSRHPVGQRESR